MILLRFRTTTTTTTTTTELLTVTVVIDFDKASEAQKGAIVMLYEKTFQIPELPNKKTIKAKGVCDRFRREVYQLSEQLRWQEHVSTASFLESKLHNHSAKWKSLFVMEGHDVDSMKFGANGPNSNSSKSTSKSTSSASSASSASSTSSTSTSSTSSTSSINSSPVSKPLLVNPPSTPAPTKTGTLKVTSPGTLTAIENTLEMIRKVTGKTFRVIDDVQKQDYMATLGSIQGREITSVDWSKFCEGIKNRQLLCNKFAIAMFALHSFISNPRHGYLILHILW